MNTQLVMNNEGHVRFFRGGFQGSTHDAVSFRLTEPIGPEGLGIPGHNLDQPPSAIPAPVRAKQMPLLAPV